MSWFSKPKAEPKTEITEAISELAKARQTRRNAMKELLHSLDQLPVENGLAMVGKELARDEGSKK